MSFFSYSQSNYSLKSTSFATLSNSASDTTSISRSSHIPESRTDTQQTFISKRNPVDQEISNQGLVPPRPASKGLHRKVKDKSYYINLLLLKKNKISAETKKIAKETDLMFKDQSTYLAYKKKAESQAAELRQLQMVLSDYNTLYDMINTEVDPHTAERKYRNLKFENEKEAVEVETLFNLRKKQEATVAEMETEINQEKYVSDILATAADQNVQTNYNRLRKIDHELSLSLQRLYKELKDVLSEKECLEEQCFINSRMEALDLLSKLRDLTTRKENIMAENKFKSSETETEQLQRQFLEYNDLLRCILQQTRNVKLEIVRTEKELEQIRGKDDDFNVHRSEKFFKLKQHEKVVDNTKLLIHL